MAAILPYRVATATGDRIDFRFPLHANTGSSVRVSQMLSAVLAVLDHEVRLDTATSNGDVLQALAMALAVRATVIGASTTASHQLCADLVRAALAAAEDAEHHHPRSGHA